MRTRTPKIKNIKPSYGIEGGKILIEGAGFDPEESASTRVYFDDKIGRIQLISNTRIVAQIPEDAVSGIVKIEVGEKISPAFEIEIGQKLAAEVNPVDSPIFDSKGNLYVCFSGKRGEMAPVSVYRFSKDGEARAHISNIPNASSLAIDADDNLYISSRFEGTVYKASPKADVTVFARDLGTPTGLAFDEDGLLYVGDRAGRILKVNSEGESSVFAEIPESMVAFHLAFDHDGNLLVSNPGLSSYNQIIMIDRYGKVHPLHGGFGRPQGLTVDAEGSIYVCEAKAGDSAIIKIPKDGEPSVFLAGPIMVGLAFDGKGSLAVASPNAAYRVTL